MSADSIEVQQDGLSLELLLGRLSFWGVIMAFSSILNLAGQQ